MSSSTKNIGQVVGLFISTVPPSNTTLIWYDETPNQCCHKVYNSKTKLWQALNPNIISDTTYSELVNNAKKNGLSIGKQYQIRDKNNVLATAITPTKIQYVDTLGNILIDDLGDNIQYHVSSSNILIDEKINGVLNSSNQLVFSFKDETPNFDTDYLLGKSRSGTNWILSKFSFRKLLSAVAGNSITWQNGFFFNFLDAIKGQLDKAGGVVSKDNYDIKMRELDTAIGNVSKENQNIISGASKAITDATSDSSIYDKKLPITIDTTVAPGDIQRLDTLSTIVSKVQRWILQFKYATGIRISKSFADAKTVQFINNNDTVESALGKVQYMLKNPTSVAALPSDWNNLLTASRKLPNDGDTIGIAILCLKRYITNILDWTYVNDIDQDAESTNNKELPRGGDTLRWVLIKLTRFALNVTTEGVLPSDWVPKTYTTDIKLPAARDTISEAFAKIVGKLNQIGLIYDGVIESRARNQQTTGSTTEDGEPKLRISLKSGNVRAQNDSEDVVQLDQNGFSIHNGDQVYFEAKKSLLRHYTNTGKSSYPVAGFKPTYAGGSTVYSGAAFLIDYNVALTAKCRNSGTNGYYDAYFGKLGVGGLIMGTVYTEDDLYITANNSMVVCNTSKGNNVNVYLPTNPENGRIIYVTRTGNGGVNVYSQGNNGIDKIGSSTTNVSIDTRGKIYMFTYVEGLNYSGESRNGLWEFAILTH